MKLGDPQRKPLWNLTTPISNQLAQLFHFGFLKPKVINRRFISNFIPGKFLQPAFAFLKTTGKDLHNLPSFWKFVMVALVTLSKLRNLYLLLYLRQLFPLLEGALHHR